MEYNEQKVIEFMNLYGEVLKRQENVIKCSGEYRSLLPEATKKLIQALSNYEKAVPLLIREKMTSFGAENIEMIRGLERVCQETLGYETDKH